MANIIQTRIKLRNDTLSNWSSSNIKIFKGEAALGYDSVSGKYEIRIGTSDDGSTWTQLAGNNLTIPAANVIGLNNTQYDYQLVETEGGTIQLQKKLPNDQNWTNVGSAISLSFADSTDEDGYSSSNPIALKNYVDSKIYDSIDDLCTDNDVVVASQSGNAVTLTKAISESGGVVDAVTGEGSTITLADVAVTGAAADVSVAADATSGLTAGTVQGKLQELKTAIDNVDSDAEVTIDDTTTTTGYLKSYTISQGGTQIGVIDIPKDLVVTSGSVVVAGDGTGGTEVIPGATAGDKYIKLTIANQTDPIYIAVKDLVDVYTGTTDATGITITVGNDNKISATCNISGSATIASVSNGVVTLKTGVTQASGAVSNDSGTDITLAKVATTGTAADVAITDSGSLLDATNVETALQEVAGKANTAVQTVTGETAISGGSDDYVSVSASKSGTEVTLDSKVKVQAVSTASSSATGLAEASDVKSYVDTGVAKKAEYLGTADAMPTTASVTISGSTVTANKGDFITYSGAEYFWSGSTWLGLGKVDSVEFAGATLTINNGTASITKAAALTALNVEDGAQVNIIETIKVGGTALTPDANKAVDIDNLILDGGSATARNGFDVDETASTGHADTRFTLQGGTVETANITGTIDQQWMVYNGYFDEQNGEWLKTITQADIGNTVTSIGYSAFWGCDSLTSVTIPDSVTRIENEAFYSCNGLTSVTIPDGVMSIGIEAFSDCSALTSVTIVANGGNAAAVKQAMIDAGVDPNITWNMPTPAGHADTRFTLEGGTVETANITGTLDRQWMIDNGYFDQDEYSWLKTITQADIGNTVSSIGSSTFKNCSELTSVTIPNNVENIEDMAFNNCTSLTSVTIPDSMTSIAEMAFNNCTSLTSVTIPDSVTSIGGGAFSDCSALTSVTIVATGKPGASAESVKQMMINAIEVSSISDNITWNMPS